MADHNNWCIDIICSLTLKYSILSAHAVNTVACIICVPIGTIDIISSISIRSQLALELPFINRLRPHHTAICHMRRMLPYKAPKQLNHSQLHKYNATKQHWQWKWQTKGKAERLNISTCLPLAAPVAEQHCRLEERNEHAEEWKEG